MGDTLSSHFISLACCCEKEVEVDFQMINNIDANLLLDFLLFIFNLSG